MNAAATLRALVGMGAPPRGRLALATALGAAAAGATVGLMACSGLLIDRAALRPPLYTLTVLMAAVQILALARGPLRYGERLVGHDAAFRATAQLRLWLYDRLAPRSPAALGSWRSGDLLARLTGDVDTLEDFYLRGLAPLVVAAVTGGLAVTLVGLLLPTAGLLLAATLVLGLALPPLLSLAAAHGHGDREARRRGELAADVVDLLQGAPDLVALGCQGEYLDRITRAEAELTRLARRRAVLAGAASATTALCTGAAVVGTVALGAVAVSQHRLPGVMLAVLPLVAMATFDVLPTVSGAVLRLADHLAAGRRLLGLEAVAVPVTDPAVPTAVPGGRDVALKAASLRYGADLPWALDSLDLAVPQGMRVALVGPSGSGKSSVVNVLMRFWGLSSGRATLGGTPVERLRQADVRAGMGLLAQDAHLFDTTIRANIALARPGASAAEIDRAARLAQLGPWLATLPRGLDTTVGHRGTRVSGGQRQRIALARTLLAESRVLLLDEPTAGLDEAMGERLLADVLAASPDRSVLLVSHRPGDTRDFDRVVTLRAGRVVPDPGRRGASGGGAVEP